MAVSAARERVRPAGPGSRVAVVAPASSFPQKDFDEGVAELRRLGFDPVWDESIFDKNPFGAGTAERRTRELQHALTRPDVDAVIAVRGGYGSVNTLAGLDVAAIRRARTAFVGYSDLTSVHAFLGSHAGLTSIHGPMLDRRLAHGPSAYDPVSFLAALGAEPMGEIAPEGLEVLKGGAASGALVGGTLTQLIGLLGTRFDSASPAGHVLFIDEVHERPYRLHRLLTHWRQAGRLDAASALVFGQLPHCDEPNGSLTSRDVLHEFAADFNGPVLFGFPSGHTTTPLVTLPFGVTVCVVTTGTPMLVFEEAAARR